MGNSVPAPWTPDEPEWFVKAVWRSDAGRYREGRALYKVNKHQLLPSAAPNRPYPAFGLLRDSEQHL